MDLRQTTYKPNSYIQKKNPVFEIQYHSANDSDHSQTNFINIESQTYNEILKQNYES